jgi:hypothetical protein
LHHHGTEIEAESDFDHHIFSLNTLRAEAGESVADWQLKFETEYQEEVSRVKKQKKSTCWRKSYWMEDGPSFEVREGRSVEEAVQRVLQNGMKLEKGPRWLRHKRIEGKQKNQDVILKIGEKQEEANGKFDENMASMTTIRYIPTGSAGNDDPIIEL